MNVRRGVMLFCVCFPTNKKKYFYKLSRTLRTFKAKRMKKFDCTLDLGNFGLWGEKNIEKFNEFAECSVFEEERYSKAGPLIPTKRTTVYSQ